MNFSLRVLMPSAYGDRRRLTPAIHRQYLDRFPDPWSRGAVLWPLARALLASGPYYDSLWRRRERLLGRPALVLWGMKDTAFRPSMLARWNEALPEARVVRVEGAGHWPQEEAPGVVLDELREWMKA
jgi:haloalkane dehalogenase